MPSDELLAAADQSFVSEMQSIDAELDTAVQEQSERYKTMADVFVLQVSEFIKNPQVINVDGHPAADAAEPAAKDG